MIEVRQILRRVKLGKLRDRYSHTPAIDLGRYFEIMTYLSIGVVVTRKYFACPADGTHSFCDKLNTDARMYNFPRNYYTKLGFFALKFAAQITLAQAILNTCVRMRHEPWLQTREASGGFGRRRILHVGARLDRGISLVDYSGVEFPEKPLRKYKRLRRGCSGRRR